jgi:hypothetical protein
MMGHINFEDHALIKRYQVGKKVNAMNRMFRDEKKKVTVEINLCLLLEVTHVFEVLEFTLA